MESESFQWLLHSSNQFTTKTSRDFLERTDLPADFLKICVEYRYRNRRTKSNSKPPLPTKDLRKILQFRRHRNRLMGIILHERSVLRNMSQTIEDQLQVYNRTRKAIRKIETTIGLQLWMSFLDKQKCDGAGVCPKCKMIFFKHGGCYSMRCPCGNQFSFPDVMLDLKLVQFGDDPKRVRSESLYRRRLLQSAEDLLLNPLGSHKKIQLKPVLNSEDLFYPGNNRSFARLPCVREEQEENDEAVFEPILRNPSCHELDQGTSNDSARIEESTDDEFSFSVLTGASNTPADSISLGDYIFVSEAQYVDELSLSSAAIVNENWEEEDSFSLLSGCDTIYSIDDHHSQTKNNVGTRPDMILSYSMATKLGNSRSKNATEVSLRTDRAPFKESKDESHCNTMSCKSNVTTKEIHGTEVDVCKSACYDEQDDDDDFFLSIYDAAKSCHGGRVAHRFKGNPRTSPTPDGWGINRRPNWSRKRRKEWKRSVRYW